VFADFAAVVGGLGIVLRPNDAAKMPNLAGAEAFGVGGSLPKRRPPLQRSTPTGSQSYGQRAQA
jgi:hypothetical protein